MTPSPRPIHTVLVVLAGLALAACTATAGDDVAGDGPRVIQPGAPGEPNRVLSAEEVADLDLSGPAHTEADVRFMQMMIPHHAQALEMTALVEDRSSRDDVPLFAQRIRISQEDEIALMVRWLEERDEDVPDLGAGHAHGDHGHHEVGELMPGMLTPEEMAQLAAATGPQFDRLFLERMRSHHQGALEMVEELFAGDGGADVEVFQFANHVDSDQRIEISRIDEMLAALEQAGD